MHRTKQNLLDAPKSRLSSTCTNCRERHLKCDGGPTCSRCRTDGRSCVFVVSRRGRRPGSRLDTSRGDRLTPSPSFDDSRYTDMQMSSSPEPTKRMDHFGSTLANRLADPQYQTSMLGQHPLAREAESLLVSRTISLDAQDNHFAHLLDIFYARVFFAHPFLLPRRQLVDLLAQGTLPHLKAVISYAASCYDPAMQKTYFRDRAMATLVDPSLPQDGYMVQALLLFSIGLLTAGDHDGVASVLSTAIRLALELGMGSHEFCVRSSYGSLVQEESWRRTWWELFIIDGYLALMRRKDKFTLFSVPSDNLLPCEDLDYVTGRIPPLRSLEELDDRANSTYDAQFSCYAYRIESVRTFGSKEGAVRSNEPTNLPFPQKSRLETYSSGHMVHPDPSVYAPTSKGRPSTPLYTQPSGAPYRSDDFSQMSSEPHAPASIATYGSTLVSTPSWPKSQQEMSSFIVPSQPDPYSLDDSQYCLTSPSKRAGSQYWSFIPSQRAISSAQIRNPVYDFGGFPDPSASGGVHIVRGGSSRFGPRDEEEEEEEEEEEDAESTNRSGGDYMVCLPLDATFMSGFLNLSSTLFLAAEVEIIFSIPKGCEIMGYHGEEMSPFFYLPSRSSRPKPPPADNDDEWWDADFFTPGTRKLSPKILSRFSGPFSTFQPTSIQTRVPHHYWIDTLPFPLLRDSIIIALHTHQHTLIDEIELIFDLTRGGMRHRGGHFADPRSWEFSDFFWLKWGWLMDKGIRKTTDMWRGISGLPRLTEVGRPGGLAMRGRLGRRTRVCEFVEGDGDGDGGRDYF
ncbi:hypothetical protein AJ80_05875 [Polytolypa hystricis UAMH7299]|uniref:Zn(2)-C6 fungal-type domain-containing protein n=1 Tax=Polytolypa hystricis (strain UAMH7299) TaxID=1447883 RepID=A0A2B7Y030_POLH7|nr:hypothetical protein AJ80_05875 [Polytolypa hystricis UAMH7299]